MKNDYYYVYTISNNVTGEVVYVGMTNEFKRRKWEHFTPNSRLSKRFGECLKGKYTMRDVGRFNLKEDAAYYEDELIEKYNTIKNGYNIKNSGGVLKNKRKKESQIKKQEYKKTEEYKIEQKRKQYEYTKRYVEKNKEKVTAYRKEWYQNNKEYYKKYYEEHKIYKKVVYSEQRA